MRKEEEEEEEVMMTNVGINKVNRYKGVQHQTCAQCLLGVLNQRCSSCAML
jgi:hypothetical protein